MHVLVCDDNRALGMLLQRLMEDFKVKTTICDSPEQAINLCGDNANDYDVVFMDIRFPVGDMDGIEAAKAIKQHNPSQIVIGCTSYELIPGEASLTFDRVIEKPVSPDVWLSIVQEFSIS